MNSDIQLLDVVALTSDMPEQSLRREQVGTVVEVLQSYCFEVEFCDYEGHTYALTALGAEQLFVLHYNPQTPQAAAQ